MQVMTTIFIFYFFLAAFVCISSAAATSINNVCTNDADCPKCPSGTHNFDTIFYFGGLSPVDNGTRQFRDSMLAAEGFMISQGHVRFVEPSPIQHCTLNYFCCYTSEQKETIINVLKGLVWKPIDFTFDSLTCNNDLNATHRSVLAMTSESTTQQMFALARRVEAAIIAAGVPVVYPRERAFHSTLGQVTLAFDVDSVIPEMQKRFPILNQEPMTLRSFALGTRIFHATDADADAYKLEKKI